MVFHLAPSQNSRRLGQPCLISVTTWPQGKAHQTFFTKYLRIEYCNMTRQFGQIPLSGGLVTGLCPREESFNAENMGQEATHGGHSEQNALSVLLGKESKNSTLSRRCFLLAPPGLFGFLTPHLTSNNVRTFPIPTKPATISSTFCSSNLTTSNLCTIIPTINLALNLTCPCPRMSFNI